MVNVPTSFNDRKTKVDDLDVGWLKTVPIYRIEKIKWSSEQGSCKK